MTAAGTARGLTTSPVPYGSLTFVVDFDFFGHVLRIDTSDLRKLEPDDSTFEEYVARARGGSTGRRSDHGETGT